MRILYGSQNFGYATKDSDRDWIEFVYPTWDDLVANNMISKESNNVDGSVTKVKDIRLLMKMIQKANFNDLQILYSKEYENCEDLEWFIRNRDRIVKSNLRQLYYTNMGYIKSCIKQGGNKNYVRAICFKEMIKRAFTDKPFELYVGGLVELRNNDSLVVSIEEIEEELIYIELTVDNYDKDLAIIEECKEKVKELLIKNMGDR